MFYAPGFSEYQGTMIPQKIIPKYYAVTDILCKKDRHDGIKYMLRVNLY